MFKKSIMAAIITCGLLAHVNAAEVSVSKLRINLENGQTADFLSLNNQSKTTKEAFEVSIYRWSQKDNLDGKDGQKAPEEVLENTQDILVSPKTLVLLPQQDKVVRLIVNNNDDAVKNYSYRMILTQLPSKEIGSNTTNTVNLLFKISLPVFIYKDPIKTADKMNIEHKVTTENGKQFLTIKNNDTQHIQIASLNMGETKFASSHYILPGITNKMELPVEFTASNLAKNPLEIATDKGNIK